MRVNLPTPWPAVAAARRHDAAQRVPFCVAGLQVGSVHRAHLGALRMWPSCLRVSEEAVQLLPPAGSEADAALAEVNRSLHQQGQLRGWRDEIYAVVPLDARQQPPAVLAHIERASARFWGTLTFGAHATGYEADPDTGQPTHLWLARRSLTKATDPGLYDNLVGGGVAAGQTPWQALLREAWEEAGLPVEIAQRASRGRVIRLHREVPEGLQLEDLHSHDLLLPTDTSPVNQDGEVAEFIKLPVAEALALAAGPEMTVDAALVTLDFALRHRMCPSCAAASALMREA